MKKLVTTFFLLIPILLCAQSNKYEKIISELSAQYKISSLTFSKEAFALLTYFDIQLKDEMKALIDDIETLKIVTPSENYGTEYVNTVCSIFSDSNLREVDVSRYVTKTNQCNVFVDNNLLSISEAHIIVNGTIVSFFGKFKHSDIRKLIKSADKVNAN